MLSAKRYVLSAKLCRKPNQHLWVHITLFEIIGHNDMPLSGLFRAECCYEEP